MKNKLQKPICLILALMMLLLTASGCAKAEPEPAETEAPTEAVVTRSVRQLKEGIQTFLIMVTDSYDITGATGSFRNGNRVDFMLLLVIDEQSQTVTGLQLNPDTMVSFSQPGQAETLELPMGQVYSYGSGGSDSFIHVTKTVTDLLGGVPVNHYLVFTLDSIGMVSDMLGGVTLTADVNAPDAEPVTVQGDEAVAFFSHREEADVSNEAHMENQRRFMLGMYHPFIESAQGDDFLTKLSLQLGERMATDLTLSQLMLTFETLSAYELKETVLTVPGTAEFTEGEYRFYPKKEVLNQMVADLMGP